MSTTNRLPKVGDVVLYYQAYVAELTPLAAIVTRVKEAGKLDSPIGLTVFHPGKSPDPQADGAIPYSEAPLAGHWSWRPE